MAYQPPSDNEISSEQLKLDIYQKAQPIIGRLKKAGIDISEFESEINGILPDRGINNPLTYAHTKIPEVLGGMVSQYKSGKGIGDIAQGGFDVIRKQIEPFSVASRKTITDYVDTAKDLLNMEKIDTPERKLNEVQYKQSMATNPVATIGREMIADPTTYVIPSTKTLQAETALGRFGKGAMVNAPFAGGTYAARYGGQDDFDWNHAGIAAGAGGVLGGLLNIPFGKPTAKASTQADMLSDEEKARRMMGGQTLPEKAPPIEAEVIDPFNQQVMDDWAKFQNGEMSLEELKAKYQRFKKQPQQIENKGVIPQPQLENNHAINMGVEGWSQPLGHRIQGALDAKAGNEISKRDEFFRQVDNLAEEQKVDDFNALMNGAKDDINEKFMQDNFPRQLQMSELDGYARSILGKPLADIIGTNGQTVKALDNPITQAQKEAYAKAQKLFDEELKGRINDNVELKGRAGYIGSPVANAIAGGGTGSLAPIDYNQDGEVSAEDRALSALLGAVGATRLAGKFSKGAKQMPKEAPNGMRNGMIVGATDNEAGAFSDLQTKKVMREIDDSGVNYRVIPRKGVQDIDGRMQFQNYAPLGTIIDHPELFKKYPELKDLMVSVSNEAGNGGSYSKIGGVALNKGNTFRANDGLLSSLESTIKNLDESPLDAEYPIIKKQMENQNLSDAEALLLLEKLNSTKTGQMIQKFEAKLSEAIRNTEDTRGVNLNEGGKKTLLHEVQHAVQEIDSLPRGGSKDDFTKLREQSNGIHSELNKMDDATGFNDWWIEQKDRLEQEIRQNGKVDFDAMRRDYAREFLTEKTAKSWFAKRDEAQKILSENKKTLGLSENQDARGFTDYENYQRLYGEQQARATEYRKDMTPEQRAKESWQQTLERVEGKYEEPIIRYDDGVAMSIEAEKRYINPRNGMLNENAIKKDAAELPERIGSFDEFKLRFPEADGDKVVLLSKNGVTVEFSLTGAWKHFLPQNNTHYDARAKFSGAFENVLRDPLLIVKEPHKQRELVFYKPFRVSGKDDVYNLASIKFEDGGFTYFDLKPINKVKDLIKATEANTLYFKHSNKRENTTSRVAVPSYDEILPQSANSVNPSLGVPAVGAGLMATSEQLKADDGSMSPLGSMLAMAGAGALAYKFGGKALKGADALASKGLSKVAQSIDNITAHKISQGWDNFTNNSIVDKLLGTKIYKLDDYMKLRSDYTKALNPTMEKLEKLHVQLAEFNQATREAMYDYMSGVKGVQLSPAIKKVADNFRSEIDKMTDELVQLGALDAKSADAFKGSYLHRSYTSKMGDIRGVFNGARKTLSDVKHRGRNWEGSEREYQRYLASGEIGDFKDGKIVANKRSDGSYQFYQDWSPAQRSKWGEIKDVAFSIPETIGRMAERLENAKFLKAISQDARYVAPKGMSDDEAKALGYVKLSGKRYGQLNGMNVRAEIATDIKAFANMVYGDDSTLKEAWKQAVSYIKSTHTIYNPAAHVNNVMSNIAFSFMAGANPMTAVKSATTGVLANRKAKEVLTLEAISSVRPLSAEESGRLQTLLLDDDVKLFKEAKLKGLFGKSNLNDTLMSYIKPRTKSTNSTVQNIHQKAGNFYGAEDDMMRYGLLKAFKNQNPRASIDELIDMVNKNIPDYTKPMSQTAQTLRDTGFVPFIAFPYYSMPIILKQMKDRPVSAATMIAMMGVLYGANDINPFNGDDIPDEGYAFKRIPIVQNGNVVHTIKVDKWLPHYDLISSVTDFSQGIAPEFLRGMLTGGIPQNLVGGAFNYNPYFNQRVTQKEGLEKAYQLGKHNVQQLTPDVLDSAYNLAESKLVDKKKRRYNKVIEPRSPIQESMKLLGINLQSYNKAEQSRKNRAEKIK